MIEYNNDNDNTAGSKEGREYSIDNSADLTVSNFESKQTSEI